MTKIAKWVLELAEVHETCRSYECGCDPETMELCTGGLYVNGLLNEEDYEEETK
jgi:hypothetical protein